jgi:hypothetical protein
MRILAGRLSRRSLLRLSGAAVAAAFAVGRGSEASQGHLLAARLRSLLPHDAAAVALGTAYLVQTPREASADRLVAALAAGPRGAALARLGQRRLGAHLAKRIRSDFAAGRTVTVRGWIVSVTEARLAALVVIG